MKNPIKAYANLNQTNRRLTTAGAVIALALTGPVGATAAAYTSLASAIADGAYFHRDKKRNVRCRAGLITFLVAATALTPLNAVRQAQVAQVAPAPIEQVVEAPAPVIVEAPAPVAEVAEEAPSIRETCDLTRFNDNPCAHGMEADAARTYEEAKTFADGNIVEVCFNSNYTSQYYSNTCKMLGRGY